MRNKPTEETFEGEYLRSICFTCGKKHGRLPTRAIGIWEDTCELCGKKAFCADAGHDFGIYRKKEEQ
jgi:hypothetical protein